MNTRKLLNKKITIFKKMTLRVILGRITCGKGTLQNCIVNIDKIYGIVFKIIDTVNFIPKLIMNQRIVTR